MRASTATALTLMAVTAPVASASFAARPDCAVPADVAVRTPTVRAGDQDHGNKQHQDDRPADAVERLTAQDADQPGCRTGP